MRKSKLGLSIIFYQLAFLTPGNKPLRALCLKHKRHKPKNLINPRGRPQTEQRFTCLVLYFGFLFDLAIFDLSAIFYFSKGNPRADNNIFALSFEVADITKVI